MKYEILQSNIEVWDKIDFQKIHLQYLLKISGEISLKNGERFYKITLYSEKIKNEFKEYLENRLNLKTQETQFSSENLEYTGYEIYFTYDKMLAIEMDFMNMEKNAIKDFLKILFVFKGYLSNPQKNYLVQIKMPPTINTEQFIQIISLKLKIKFKIHKKNILYLQNKEDIIKLFTYINAVSTVLNIQNIIVEKELHNQQNRITNFQIASEIKKQKTIERQLKIIKMMQAKNIKIEGIELQIANYRINNTNDSISELTQKMQKKNIKVSRSKIHRFFEKYAKKMNI